MPLTRSENMRRIKAKDTSPEVAIRQVVHRLGYRFRLHRKDLPGKPDLVFPARRKVIFVHGCFWHQHTGCREGHKPKSNEGYWAPKLARNQERDKQNLERLKEAGWDVLVIWECETGDKEMVAVRIKDFLGPPGCAAKAGHPVEYGDGVQAHEMPLPHR
jgi:DNA mismatch endonuclease (patch repair protein)